MTINVPMQLTAEQLARLEEIAAHEAVDLSVLLSWSAERILQDDAAWIAAVQEGLDSAARGELIEHEVVMAELEAKIKAFEATQA